MVETDQTQKSTKEQPKDITELRNELNELIERNKNSEELSSILTQESEIVMKTKESISNVLEKMEKVIDYIRSNNDVFLNYKKEVIKVVEAKENTSQSFFKDFFSFNSFGATEMYTGGGAYYKPYIMPNIQKEEILSPVIIFYQTMELSIINNLYSIEKIMESIKKEILEHSNLLKSISKDNGNTGIFTLTEQLETLNSSILKQLDLLRKKIEELEKKVPILLEGVYTDEDINRYKDIIRDKIGEVLPQIKKNYAETESEISNLLNSTKTMYSTLSSLKNKHQTLEKALGIDTSTDIKNIPKILEENIKSIPNLINETNNQITNTILSKKLGFIEYIKEVFSNMKNGKNSHFFDLFKSNIMNTILFIAILIFLFILLVCALFFAHKYIKKGFKMRYGKKAEMQRAVDRYDNCKEKHMKEIEKNNHKSNP